MRFNEATFCMQCKYNAIITLYLGINLQPVFLVYLILCFCGVLSLQVAQAPTAPVLGSYDYQVAWPY